MSILHHLIPAVNPADLDDLPGLDTPAADPVYLLDVLEESGTWRTYAFADLDDLATARQRWEANGYPTQTLDLPEPPLRDPLTDEPPPF